jgi:hypothetical protein
VRGDHDGGAGLEGGGDRRHGGADAGVFGDVAGVILRHVQVGADEHALSRQRLLVDQVLQTGEIENSVHGIPKVECGKNAILPEAQAETCQKPYSKTNRGR